MIAVIRDPTNQGNMSILVSGNVSGMGKLNGGVAVGTNGTIADFDGIKTNPMRLPHAALLKMLKEQAAKAKAGSELDPSILSGVSDLPNAVVGINGGMAGKDLAGTMLTKEEEVDMNTCFETSTKEQVHDQCATQQPDENLTKLCAEDFCNTCCTTVVPAHKKQDHLEKCVKVCNSKRTEPEAPWKVCTDPVNPKQSSAVYCERITIKATKETCLTDACKNCCYNLDVELDEKSSHEVKMKCHKECTAKFVGSKPYSDEVVSLASEVQELTNFPKNA